MPCNTLISVIMPVYNTEKYLERSLDSVLGQKNCSLQVICVNDGSTDGSLDILQRYAGADTRLTVISTPNQGPARARNVGLSHARGTWIAFLDSDDFLHAQAYSIVSAAFAHNPHIICYRFSHVDDNADASAASVPQTIRGGLTTLTNDLRFSLNYIVWDKLFRKDLIDKYNIVFPEKIIHEDNVFYLNYAFVAEKIYILENSLYFYTQRNTSLMGAMKKKGGLAVDSLYASEKIYAFLQKNNLYSKYFDLFLQIFKYHVRFSYFNTSDALRPVILDKIIHLANTLEAPATYTESDFFLHEIKKELVRVIDLLQVR